MTERPGLLRRLADVPQRLFLAVVAAGVIAGLTIAAAVVWLTARLQRRGW